MQPRNRANPSAFVSVGLSEHVHSAGHLRLLVFFTPRWLDFDDGIYAGARLPVMGNS